MTSNEIRTRFLEYFKQKGHTIVPSSSLIPDDPSVLLTTAGMQQFKPYYAELDPNVVPLRGLIIGPNACSVQKCFRTSDIDEVGDERHLTFFEMLGNFSFGGYYKEKAITYAYEFITKILGLKISYITVFEGKDSINVPKDTESINIWHDLDSNIKIIEQGMDDVFWGPTGDSGPCGPTTEIYCETSEGKPVEVWNIVFNEFFCKGSREDLLAGHAKLKKFARPGVDTGMGFERLVTMVQGVKTVFDTDIFQNIFGDLLNNPIIDQRSTRIIADHLRSSVFLMADGITPSNKDRGYILRRIIRRLIVHSKRINLSIGDLERRINLIIKNYNTVYPEIEEARTFIIEQFEREAEKFNRTFDKGLIEFRKQFPPVTGNIASRIDTQHPIKELTIKIVGAEAFNLYQSFGLTPDVIKDLLTENNYIFDEEAFGNEFRKHQEISKAGATGKFGGHGLILNGELKAANEDEVKKVTRLHTATHLLHTALRKVLGDAVHQQGSDITPERLRFDFTYPQKMTVEQVAQVEKIVNDEVAKDDKVTMVEMPFKEAVAQGALAFFKNKYPETVKVYSVGDYSKEVCGGPHVAHTIEVGQVKIVKEEAVSAGVRRIRAVVEP